MTKYEVVWTYDSIIDLSNCVSFVLNVSKDAAIKLRDDFSSYVESLKDFPERNPIFKMPKSFPYVLRKAVINKRYLVLYAVSDEQIIIYRIVDARKGFSTLIK